MIATLVYLSAQIRHNNDQLRGAATTAVWGYQRTLTEMLSAAQELYKIALRGNEDLSSLDSWEQQRFTIWAIHETGLWEMCHLLLKQGALDEEFYLGKEAYWLQFHSSPGRREWWHTHSVMLNEGFYTDVSRQLEAIPVRRRGDSIPISDSSGHVTPA